MMNHTLSLKQEHFELIFLPLRRIVRG